MVILTTADSVEGYEIVQYKGLIAGVGTTVTEGLIGEARKAYPGNAGSVPG